MHGIPEFSGPQMELACRLVPISQGPKNLGIPGPYPLQLPHVMYIHPHMAQTGFYPSKSTYNLKKYKIRNPIDDRLDFIKRQDYELKLDHIIFSKNLFIISFFTLHNENKQSRHRKEVDKETVE